MQLFVSVLVCVCALTQAAVKQDEVLDLPGLTFKPTFKSYSGYLKATGTNKLHYWYVISCKLCNNALH